MNEDQLSLNSLSRFSKQSGLLHLEEHGHCEVPAGCGGVVLRWYNPATSIPLLLRLFCAGKASVFIDGTVPTSARPLVVPGRRILTIEVSEASHEQALIMFAAVYDRRASQKLPEEARCAVLSAADGSWFFTVTPPRDDTWRVSDADMIGWEPMIELPIDVPDRKQAWQRWYSFEQLTKVGARALGIPTANAPQAVEWFRNATQRVGISAKEARCTEPAAPIWIRKAFEVSL